MRRSRVSKVPGRMKPTQIFYKIVPTVVHTLVSDLESVQKDQSLNGNFMENKSEGFLGEILR